MEFRMRALLLGLVLVSGCGQPPEGFLWEVTLTATTDECNDPVVPYRETFDYLLDLSSPPVASIALGNEGVFATGRISGDFIDYSSVIWTDYRNDGDEIRWQISGEAQFRTGGTNGSLPEGVDWAGTEQFEIVDSFDADLEEGCVFIMESEGVYKGEQ